MAIKWKTNGWFILAGLLVFSGWQLVIKHAVTTGQQSLYSYSQANLTESLSSLYTEDYLANFNEKTIVPSELDGSIVNEYRYRLGDYENQVRDITNQYREEIALAQVGEDEKLVKGLEETRDEKILDITDNFMDDQKVEEKVAKELTAKVLKEKQSLLESMANNKSQFNKNYWYYLTDDKGKIYKNLQSLSAEMSEHKIIETLKERGAGPALNIQTGLMAPGVLHDVWESLNYTGEMTGYVTLINGSDAALAYQDEVKVKRNSTLLASLGIIAVVIGGLLYIKELWRPTVDFKLTKSLAKLPIDLEVISLIGITLGLLLTSLNLRRIWGPGRNIIGIMIGFGLIYAGMFLSRDLWLRLKNKEKPLKVELQNSVIYRITKKLQQKYYQLPLTLRVSLSVLGFSFVSFILWLIYRTAYYHYWQYQWGFRIIVLLSAIGILIKLVTKRERKIEEVLTKPAEILAANDEEFTQGQSLSAVSENLAQISRIVATSKAQKNRSDELKTELLTNVSHDLRTPLTSIITYGDLLTNPELTKDKQGAYTEIINRKALRMKNLIDDLFEVTKMSNGEVQLNRKMINLGQLIQQGIAEYSEELANKELKLLYSKPEESILMEIDGDRMWRVFDNLVGNVVKYSMPGTRVYLKLAETATGVRIQLKNISNYELNEDAEKLVERFTRGDEARNTEGSGLGLAIANSIITLHQGTLSIEVDGDMFKLTIDLPREVSEQT